MVRFRTKKPVMPTLRLMKVGEVASFPVERLEVVRVTANRLGTMKRREGWKFQMKTKGLLVQVTRTA